ncbi:hypothetical protein OHB26_35465 [Nocardia sp. NBC_01503]|uniref:TlpA family protein disulfide reductase n=1 Tax=Nocardia sp. NBC_01503 TaxID=2975997 RepID=UPI002E7AEFBD|nr:hypothetical protein [Nocardia sp. NBC_01503]WTL32132.1 hypothetical protein OHB26_35465 [Nocardia sp. NBC_01503]
MTWPWITVVCLLAFMVLAQALTLTGLITRTTAALEQVETLLTRNGAPGPAPGTPLPTLTLYHHEQPIRLDQRYAGQPLLLLFLSSGCPHCTRLVSAFADTPAGPPITVLAISDTDDHATTLPSWITPLRDREDTFLTALGIDRVPLALAINPDHTVHTVQTPTTPASLHTLAEALTEPHEVPLTPVGL